MRSLSRNNGRVGAVSTPEAVIAESFEAWRAERAEMREYAHRLYRHAKFLRWFAPVVCVLVFLYGFYLGFMVGR